MEELPWAPLRQAESKSLSTSTKKVAQLASKIFKAWLPSHCCLWQRFCLRTCLEWPPPIAEQVALPAPVLETSSDFRLHLCPGSLPAAFPLPAYTSLRATLVTMNRPSGTEDQAWGRNLGAHCTLHSSHKCSQAEPCLPAVVRMY